METKTLARGPQIVIVQREDWHSSFDLEQRELALIAGQFLLAFEHVGSTAVPGLAGKPVIDILAGANALEKADAISERLGNLGYIRIPFRPSTPNTSPMKEGAERLFFLKRPLETSEGADTSHPGYNVHVVPIDKLHGDEQVLLRDYLRSHPELVAEYIKLKCEIVGRITDYKEYAPAKSAFIERVLASARMS